MAHSPPHQTARRPDPPTKHTDTVLSGTVRYKDPRSAVPDELKEMQLDFFMPKASTIGRRDDETELLGAYLLHHYFQNYANDMHEGLADRFSGFTLRKHSEMVGMSVVVSHDGMKNVLKKIEHVENGNTKSLSVVVGSVIHEYLKKEQAARGLTGAGSEVRNVGGKGVVCAYDALANFPPFSTHPHAYHDRPRSSRTTRARRRGAMRRRRRRRGRRWRRPPVASRRRSWSSTRGASLS